MGANLLNRGGSDEAIGCIPISNFSVEYPEQVYQVLGRQHQVQGSRLFWLLATVLLLKTNGQVTAVACHFINVKEFVINMRLKIWQHGSGAPKIDFILSTVYIR